MQNKIIKHLPAFGVAGLVMFSSAIFAKLIEKTNLSNSENLQNPDSISQITPAATPEITAAATPGITAAATPGITAPSSIVEERISFGNKILIKQEETGAPNLDFQVAKDKGIKAMVAGDSTLAVSAFEEAIQKYRNAPETLIYLNNAKLEGLNPYTIAVVVPIGKNVNGALEILRGVAQAQNQVNEAGGINGVPLKVLIANDDNDPAIARQIAAELVKDTTVLGVIGHYGSDVTLAAKEEYNAGLVAISAISTAVKLSDSSPYIYRTVPNDAIAAKALAKHMVTKLKKKKAAVFYNSQSTYSQSLKSKFIEEVFANGGQVDTDLEFDLSNSSFSPSQSVQQAIDKRTEMLMLAADTSMLDKALLVIQANKKRLSLIGGDGLYTPKILVDGGDAAVGLVVGVAWQFDANPETTFSQKSQELWQGKVNWRTAMSYDAGQALIAALGRDPSPTRASVKQALSAANFSANGASQTIKFLSSGDRDSSVQLVEVRPSKSPNTGYEFIPIR